MFVGWPKQKPFLPREADKKIRFSFLLQILGRGIYQIRLLLWYVPEIKLNSPALNDQPVYQGYQPIIRAILVVDLLLFERDALHSNPHILRRCSSASTLERFAAPVLGKAPSPNIVPRAYLFATAVIGVINRPVFFRCLWGTESEYHQVLKRLPMHVPARVIVREFYN